MSLKATMQLKFSLEKKLKTMGEIHAVKDRILSTIPKEILFTNTREELCSHVLDHFDFVPGTIRANDSESIQNGCAIILELMGVDDEFKNTFETKTTRDLEDNIALFMHYFLEFDSLPGTHKDRLEELNKIDLDEINEQIKEYEKNSFIVNSEKPRNHKERTIRDFYNRCIGERIKIKEHLRSGIEPRAIQKAGSHNSLGGIGALFDSLYDRPYRSAYPKAKQFFDDTAIDKVSHRILELPIGKGGDLAKLYKTKKGEFYKELNKVIPFKKELEVMVANVNWLPFINPQREGIFREIVSLYKTKRFFGAYTLALTQIEGLFTDMCQVCNPGYRPSLPDKVEAVRPYNVEAEGRMDYFQYYLPVLRNRFLHYGTDSEEAIDDLCHDILYDLIEVVSIFYQLNIDANKLLRLIRKRDDADFMHVEGLAFYFRVLRGVRNKKQLSYFGSELQAINETYLPAVIFNIAYELHENIETNLEKISPVIKLRSKQDGFEIDIRTTPIDVIIKNPVKPDRNLYEVVNFEIKSEITYLLQVDCILNGYKKGLDINFVDSETINHLDKLQKKYKLILDKIKMISNQLNFKPYDN